MDKQLIPLQKKINTLAEEAKTLAITSKDEMVKATTVLSNINKYVDSVKEQKDKLTKPINEALKNIKTMFKPLEESYEEAITIIRSKMTKYQTEETARVREEEAKIAARVKEGKGNLTIETAVSKIANIERPDVSVEVGSGTVQFVATKKFEIVNKSKIPLEYMIPDEVSIRKAMKEGKELPGIRYFTEQVPRNYR